MDKRHVRMSNSTKEAILTALEFYADPDNWKAYGATGVWVAFGKMEDDMGAVAKKALQRLKDEIKTTHQTASRD